MIGWLDAHDRIENSDNDPCDDRIIAAWKRLGGAIGQELVGLEG